MDGFGEPSYRQSRSTDATSELTEQVASATEQDERLDALTEFSV